jgi:sugar phosphate isomerase/epimerase
MPKFGVSIYSVSRKFYSKEWTPMQGIKWLAEQGAEAIEMVPFGIDFINDPSMIDKCLDAAKEAGVPIVNFSLNANFLQLTDEEYTAEVARVKQYIDVAGKLKVPTMRIDCAGFRRPIETNTTANFIKELPTIVKTYEDLCAYASQYGITILLENHGFHVNGADRTAFVFEAMKGKNFGGQLDCGNFVCVDELPDVAIKKNIGYATTIHMKDFYIRPESRDPGDASQFNCSNSWFRSVSGRYLRGSILAQGDLDIPAIIATIKHSGFDGNIFIEYEGMEDCEYGTKVSLENLKRIWAQA